MPFCKHMKAVKKMTLKITWCGFILSALTKNVKGWVMLKLLGGQNSRQSDQMTAKQKWFQKCISNAHWMHWTSTASYEWTKWQLLSCKLMFTHTHKIGQEKQSLKKKANNTCELLSTSSCICVCVCVCN